MTRWSRVQFIRQIQSRLRSKWTRSTSVLVILLLVIPVSALAQGSPFDTGFTAIQSLFTGTIAKVASLVAIVIGGYRSINNRSVDVFEFLTLVFGAKARDRSHCSTARGLTCSSRESPQRGRIQRFRVDKLDCCVECRRSRKSCST
jgi:type IV secretory pathway VirB2 component (pilin)